MTKLYLPVREPPVAGESLTGYVRRHTLAMGYDGLRQLLSLPEKINFPPYLDHLTSGPQLQALSDLLRRDEHTLVQMTAHRWAQHLVFRGRTEPEPVTCDSRTLRRLFNAARPRVCVRCLEAAPTEDQLVWSFRPLGICSHHGDVLLERCPHCRRPFSRIRLDLVRCRCGYALTGGPPRRVHGRVLEMGRLIAAWLAGAELVTVNLPPSAGFWWLDRLRFAAYRAPDWCAQTRREWDVPDSLSHDSFCWLAAAWLVWASPGELLPFLEAYRTVDRHRLTPSRAGRYFGILLQDVKQLERSGYPVAPNTCASMARALFNSAN